MKKITNKDLKVFAFIWSVIFVIIGTINNITWLYYLSIVFIVFGYFNPIIFINFYKIWIKIGTFMGSIISKVIMFVLYFGLFTPISVFLKILGKDLLNKKIDKSPNSYWIKRERQPESMKNQF